VYVSRWESAEKAGAFAAIYARSLVKRYKQVQEVVQKGQQITNLENTEILKDSHSWLTEEGPVTIHQEGDELLITESLDQPTEQKLDEELFAAPVTASH
jgi:hypothetical protein